MAYDAAISPCLHWREAIADADAKRARGRQFAAGRRTAESEAPPRALEQPKCLGRRPPPVAAIV
jgi:hypothetical protein